MGSLRREPFRLLFPLAAVIGWLGVLPWVLVASGAIHHGAWAWPAIPHSLVMTQAFLPAIAVGFLGTMIPRRTATAPMHAFELLGLAAAPAVMSACFALGALAIGEGFYLLSLLGLARFAIVRLLARDAEARGGKSPPGSFVFIPAGLAAGLAGGGLLLAFARGGHPALFAPGRALVEEALPEALVLALAPLLTPAIVFGAPVGAPAAGGGRRVAQVAWIGATLVFLGSFAVEYGGLQRAARLGPLARGLIIATVLLGAGRLWRASTVPGLHRRLYRIALLLVPIGPLGAGLAPGLRVALLHVTFIGGFSLLVFAVSLHVVMLHTGREALARSAPRFVLLVAALTLTAAAVRVSADRLPHAYLLALGAAAALWLLAGLVWGGALLRMVIRPPRAAETA